MNQRTSLRLLAEIRVDPRVVDAVVVDMDYLLDELLPRIKYISAPRAANDPVIKIDIKKLDKSWQKDPMYIGKGGVGGIGKRYAQFIKFLQYALMNGIAIEMPEIGISDRGNIAFTNGRHRYSVLRDLGVKDMLVNAVRSQEAAEIKRRFGV